MRTFLARLLTLLVAISALAVADVAKGQLVAWRGIAFADLAEALRWHAGPLDEATWRKVEAVYAAYIEQAEAVRLGTDLDPISDERSSLAWRDPEVAKTYWRSQAAIRERWSAVDRSFIEEVIRLLPSGRDVEAEALRQWHDRLLAAASRNWSFGTEFCDMPARFRRARFTGDDRTVVDEEMVALERALLPIERKRAARLAEVAIESIKARHRLPPRPPDDDPKAQQAWWEMRASVMRASWEPLLALDAEGERVADKCFDRLLPRLAPNGQRLALVTFLASRFESMGVGGEVDLGEVRRWLGRRDLDPEKREAATQRIASWREGDDRNLRELVRLARAWWIAEVDSRWKPWPTDGPPESWKLRERVEEMSARRSGGAVVMRNEVAKLLGLDEAAQEPEETDVQPPEDDLGGLLAATRDEDAPTEEEEPVADDGGMAMHSWVGRPLAQQDVARLIEELKLGRDQQATVEALYADFITAWSETVTPLVAKATEMTERSVESDGRVDESLPALRSEAWRTARAKAIALQEEFHVSVQAVVPAEAADALAMWRLRIRLGKPEEIIESKSGFDGGVTTLAERYGNMAEAVERAELEPGSRGVAQRVVAGHGDELLATREELFERELRSSQLMWEAEARYEALSLRGIDAEEDPSMRAAYQAIERDSEEFQQRAAELAKAAKALDAELEAALEPAAWRRVRLEASKAVYPGLDGDRKVTARIFERLARLALDPVRTERAQMVEARWRAEFDPQTDRLAELGQSPMPDAQGTRMPGHEFRMKQEWFLYRRDAATQVAKDALARLLTPEERKRIGGLPRL